MSIARPCAPLALACAVLIGPAIAPARAEEPQPATERTSVGSLVVDPAVLEVQRCVRKNLPERSAEQEIRLEKSDASGVTQTLEARLYWKRAADGRSRVLVRIEGPADLRGSAFLAIEREGAEPNMFTYLPELKTVRRVTTRTLSGSLFGTDFSYEDLLQLQGVDVLARVERLPDESVDGRPAYVLVATPTAEAGSAYQKVVTRIDQETCVVHTIEFFSKAGEVAKEIRVDPARVKPEKSHQVPREIVLYDREGGGETKLVVKKIALDVDLPDALFSQGALAKGH